MKTQRGSLLTTVAYGLGACALAASANAQFGEILPPPLPPTDITPASGTWEGKHGHRTPLVLGWTQVIPTGPGPFINQPATHFLVCIDSYAPNTTPPPCNLATYDHLEAVGSSALVRSGNRFTFAPTRFVEDAELDLPLRITVVACSTLMNRSCRGSSTDPWFSSMNIDSDAASENANTTAKRWKLDVRAMNPGTGAVPAFSGTLQLFEVLSYGNPGRSCLQELDDLGEQPDLVVIDKNGSMTPLPMARDENGNYNGFEIAGIFRMGSFTDTVNFTTTGNPTLAGEQLKSRGIKELDFLIADATPDRTFVVRATLDTGDVIREFNENDNVAAACRRR